MSDSSQQSVLVEKLFDKPLHVEFNGLAQSSDGGLVLLKSADDALKITSRLGKILIDKRSPLKVKHSYRDCFTQRVFSIAGGYEDGNDAGKMRHDPALLLSCGRDPLDPDGLASQTTISRMENAVSARETVLQGQELESIGVEMLKKRMRSKRALRKKRIVIDLDPSVDPTHGAQQGSLFHAFYRSWCYLPMFGFLSFEGEPDHVPIAARLRPGNSKEQRGTIPLLRRIVAKLREVFGPRRSILVRLDAGFAHPRVLEALDELGVKYVVGMPSNDILKVWAEEYLPGLGERAEESRESERDYAERKYKARSWKRERRVVLKAEAIPYPDRATKDNPRLVVTNLRTLPERTYAIDCVRGDAENRIKEVKRDLHVDRTSCCRFVANQLRVIMTAAAYMLHVELRWRLRRTRLATAQVSRLMTTLIKVSVVVKRSVRRYLLQLPAHSPFAQERQAAAKSLGALRC